MDRHEFLAERFEQHRPRLRAVAFRVLGSFSEADDAVQESWLRLSRSETRHVENLGGWLTTIVARVSLNMLSSRRARREEPLEGTGLGPPEVTQVAKPGPEDEVLLGDALGLALLVVLDSLSPRERLAFVLHDMFAVPFDEIAPIVGRSPAATRQLASRARRRVRGAGPAAGADPARQRAVVGAFLTASRGGDFAALLALLDPDAVLRADRAAVALGATGFVQGAPAIAHTFSGRAHGAGLALIDGVAGALWAPGGEARIAFAFTVGVGAITAISLIAEPAHLARLRLEPLVT
jgi:RNA polymerase sigma-70 factor (ECF subfamily)